MYAYWSVQDIFVSIVWACIAHAKFSLLSKLGSELRCALSFPWLENTYAESACQVVASARAEALGFPRVLRALLSSLSECLQLVLWLKRSRMTCLLLEQRSLFSCDNIYAKFWSVRALSKTTIDMHTRPRFHVTELCSYIVLTFESSRSQVYRFIRRWSHVK